MHLPKETVIRNAFDLYYILYTPASIVSKIGSELYLYGPISAIEKVLLGFTYDG